MVYFGDEDSPLCVPKYSWILGKIIIPTTPGDTDGYATFRLNRGSGTSSPETIGITVYHPSGSGVPTGYGTSYTNNYDIFNMWTAEATPKLNFKSIEVTKAGLPVKGFIDTDVVRVAGPTAFGASIVGNLIMNTPTGPLTCLCGDLFTPWGSVSLSERYGYFVDYPVL